MATDAPVEPAFGAIQQTEVFDFDEAYDACNEALRSFRGVASQRDYEFAFDFTLLSAAECALVPSLTDPLNPQVSVPVEEPFSVPADAVWVAVARADCGWTNLHGIKSDPAAVRPWDVMLFAGDMAKAELVAGVQDRIHLEHIESLVAGIEQMYQGSPAPQGPATAEAGLVRIQGMLWTAKAALQLAPESIREHLESYLHTYPLV